jgi:hypothetical protein
VPRREVVHEGAYFRRDELGRPRDQCTQNHPVIVFEAIVPDALAQRAKLRQLPAFGQQGQLEIDAFAHDFSSARVPTDSRHGEGSPSGRRIDPQRADLHK